MQRAGRSGHGAWFGAGGHASRVMSVARCVLARARISDVLHRQIFYSDGLWPGYRTHRCPAESDEAVRLLVVRKAKTHELC